MRLTWTAISLCLNILEVQPDFPRSYAESLFHIFKPSGVATICALMRIAGLNHYAVFNIAGMLFLIAPVLRGATNIMITQFDPLPILQAIDKYKATFWYSAVPMNLGVMAHPEASKYDLSSLKLNLCTSFVVALDEKISKQWEAFTNGCELWRSLWFK